MSSRLNLDGNPDYVRVIPGGSELWITLPGKARIDVVGITGDVADGRGSDLSRRPRVDSGLFRISDPFESAMMRVLVIAAVLVPTNRASCRTRSY